MIEEIREGLKKFSLPQKPKSFGEEYHFPETIEMVSSVELGSWMFKLAAWKGYALRMLANAEIERTFLRGKNENKLAQKIAENSEGNKKMTKDHALGVLIKEDVDFKDARGRLIKKEAEVDSIKQIIEIYAMQIEVVSREISRRALDVKLIQKGIIE
jgi:hypothetical protein